MRTPLIAVIILYFSLRTSAQVSIPNAGFELTDGSSSTLSESWKTEGSLDYCHSDTVEHFEGKRSMHLVRNDQQGVGRFYQELNVTYAELKKFTISVAIKLKNVQYGFTGVSVRSLGADGNLICHQNLNMYPAKINGTRDWQIYAGDFYVTPETVKLKIAGYLLGTGEVWFDQITLTEIPLSTEKNSAEIAGYITRFFAIIRKNGIIVDKKHLTELKKRTYLLCQGNEDLNYCHFILKNITMNLNDGHSFFSTPSEWKELQEKSNSTPTSMVTFSTGRMLDNKIAFISIPTFHSVEMNLVRQNVDTLHRLIEKLDSQNPVGWIIDLSENSGGNSLAMYPGLGPIIGNGICGYSISANGNRMTRIYRDGMAGWENQLDTLTTNPYRAKNSNLPIAVIYSENTASSGEVTALALRGLKNCRSFGQPTYGATTRVDNFMLSDSAYLNLASGFNADRTGEIFKGVKINPDVLTNNREEAIISAIAWITTFDDE